jgi:hypothetical protein
MKVEDALRRADKLEKRTTAATPDLFSIAVVRNGVTIRTLNVKIPPRKRYRKYYDNNIGEK